MSHFKIQTITAFVSVGEDGDEGIMSVMLGNTQYPLLCADEKRVAMMYPLAEEIAKEGGMQYRIVQFSVRTDVTEETHDKYKNTIQ